jgi:hypothetical protein
MRVGATEKTFFDCWHPDADKLFNVTSSLRKVCWDLCDPESRLEDKVFLDWSLPIVGYGHKTIPMLPATVSQLQQAKFATSSGYYGRENILDRGETGW